MPDETPAPPFSASIELNQNRINVVELSDADKEMFYKSVLADKPFEEVFPLFDGQYEVRFKAMTVEENSAVVNQIALDRKAKIAADDDSYMVTIASYRLAIGLQEINGKPFSQITKATYTPVDDTDSFVAARARAMQKWATCKLSVFLDAFQAFEGKVIKLSNEVQTRNFWKASA